MKPLPFEGLLVVDLAWVVAGPMIGRTLADYGATVIRVESSKRMDTARVMGPFPQGRMDPAHSALYENCNAGKLGITLDLSRPQGQEILKDLVTRSGVLVESFSPGQMQRWGLDYAELRKQRSDLIMVSTSLMGQTGPYSSFAGYGNIGAAMSGFQQIVGEKGGIPIGPFGPYTDYVAPRFGIVSLLAALDHRRRTGEGCWIDLSQAEAGIQLLAPQVAAYSLTGEIAEACGNEDAEMAPHGVFPCRAESPDDERWIAIAVRSDAEWQALAHLMERPDLATDTRLQHLAGRQARQAELYSTVAAWCTSGNASDLEQRLQQRGIAAAVVASSADMLADPQLAARQHFLSLDHPISGQSVIEASRYLLSDTPGTPRRAAPALGQDNDYVLGSLLDYSAARVASLREAGALS